MKLIFKENKKNHTFKEKLFSFGRVWCGLGLNSVAFLKEMM